MVELRRTIRFAINPGGTASEPDSNGFGGVPAMCGLGRFYEIDAACRGQPDPATGYLINIKDIDDAVRAVAVPIIAEACEKRPSTSPESLLPQLAFGVRESLASKGVRLVRLRWRLTPTYSVEMLLGSIGMPGTPDAAVLRQQFDFAASHRLHVPGLSDEANRASFGKCNNPAGHGHNYRIEVAVNVETGAHQTMSLGRFEEIVGRTLIDRFDHKHLNVDTPEFNASGGVNPSVENIARVFFSILAPAMVRESGGNTTLRSITVWETDRTCATYPASG